MRIALAQMNTFLGAFAENRQRILDFVNEAVEKHCDLIVFPELALFGYLPGDLLERRSVFRAQWQEFRKLEKQIPAGISVLVGLVVENKNIKGKPYYNSAALIKRGAKTRFFHKELLPNYDIFDDSRFFEPGKNIDNIVNIKGYKTLITLCEDIWGWGQDLENANYRRNPLKAASREGVDLVLNLSASPFSIGHSKRRKQVVKKTATLFRAPIVYVNMVGGQDELVFDGGSFAVDEKGRTIAQSVYFKEDLNVVDLKKNVGGIRSIEKEDIANVYGALVLGTRSFIHKIGFKKAHLGLSGGIDSAIVACIAVDALGPQNVTLIALPGPYSSAESYRLAKRLAENLGCQFLKLTIDPVYKKMVQVLDQSFGKSSFGLVHENLQSRLRGLTLMAYSNRESSILLTTGNKSEYATGYSTLYGDMSGALAPIGDLLKTQVFALARYINHEHEVIPERIIQRPPTAELRENQIDQDSLPSYKVLDAAIESICVNRHAAKTKTEKWLLKQMARMEFKRWQSPPILRVSIRAFGRGRRYPIAHKALF